MNTPVYPREIWKGNTPKSSQVYRAVLVEWEKFEFEMFAGKDAMGNEIWQSLDKDEDGSGWYSIALAMALTMSKESKVAK